MKKVAIKKISALLDSLYPNATCALDFRSPFELLIATILSAQCTDKRVNIVTSRLFLDYNTPEKMAALTKEDLIPLIKDCGLFNNKSQNIINTSKILVAEYNSQVPPKREDLENLPGVGRKTANVVLGNAFNIPAFPVDTHVFRVSHRLGLSLGKSPEKVEADLCRQFSKKTWIRTHHQLILHGRTLCKAKSPLCNQCQLNCYCRFYFEGKQLSEGNFINKKETIKE